MILFSVNNILFHFQSNPPRDMPVPPSKLSFTVTDLDPYKTYTFSVAAKNSLGSSVKSVAVTVRTLATSKLAII